MKSKNALIITHGPLPENISASIRFLAIPITIEMLDINSPMIIRLREYKFYNSISPDYYSLIPSKTKIPEEFNALPYIADNIKKGSSQVPLLPQTSKHLLVFKDTTVHVDFRSAVLYIDDNNEQALKVEGDIIGQADTKFKIHKSFYWRLDNLLYGEESNCSSGD